MPKFLQRVGGDVERALSDVNVPSYVIDREGVIAWLNPAAEAVVGDVRGRRFTDVVVASERSRAREVFARKIVGTTKVTDTEVDVLDADGAPIRVEISSVPLHRGHQIIGVFGLLSRPPEPVEGPHEHPQLTPRQLQVLRMLALGSSTDQIGTELHIARETVRNHVRGILRALDAHSRVEAIAVARADGLLAD